MALLTLAACTRQLPVVSANAEDGPQIQALTLSQSLVTENAPFDLTAEISGGAGQLFVDGGEGQDIDGTVSLSLSRTRGEAFEEHVLLVRVTAATGESVDRSVRVTLVQAPVTPVLDAPNHVQLSSTGTLARVEGVVGMRYTWTVADGTLLSPEIGTDVAFAPLGFDAVTLTVVAENAAGARSAEVSARVPVEGYERKSATALLRSALFLPNGDVYSVTFEGLFHFDASTGDNQRIAVGDACDPNGLRGPLSVSGDANMLYVGDGCRHGTNNSFLTVRTLKADVINLVNLCGFSSGGVDGVLSYALQDRTRFYVTGAFGLYAVHREDEDCIPGPGTSEILNKSSEPQALSLAPNGELFLSDPGRHAIYRIEAGAAMLYAGSGDPALAGKRDGARLGEALFKNPGKLGFATDGRIFVVDEETAFDVYGRKLYKGAVRVIDGEQVSTLATAPSDTLDAWNIRLLALLPNGVKTWVAVEPDGIFNRVSP